MQLIMLVYYIWNTRKGYMIKVTYVVLVRRICVIVGMELISVVYMMV